MNDISFEMELRKSLSYKRWRQTFTAEMVENITQKTGNRKSFKIFLKMLVSALEDKSSVVSYDVLTSEQLEFLRNNTVNKHNPVSTIGEVISSISKAH